MLCQAGFDALDYSMFDLYNPDHPLNGDRYEAYALRLRSLAESLGISFRQSHAPFPSFWENDDKFNRMAFTRIVRAMEVSGLLGIGIIVVHPIDISDKGSMKQVNLDFYRRLQPYSEKFGVKIALENMWG